MLKIYGRANSINVRKVLWVADELGLAFSREDWGRGYRATSEPEFQKLNPFALVPVIDDDGFLVRESNTIVRYLAAKHGRSDLYPTDVQSRARIEAWMDWTIAELSTALRPVFFGLQLKNPAYTDPSIIAAGVAAWSQQVALLDQELSNNGPYVAGKTFSIADIGVGLGVNRWFSLPFERPELRHVSAYYDRLSERPAFMKHGRNGTP